MIQNHEEMPLSGSEPTPRSEMAEEGPVSTGVNLEEHPAPAGVQVTIVQDEDIPCPECGAYWGNPDPALDFPNRFKTDQFCRCYNPGCPVAMYNPFTGEVEHEGQPITDWLIGFNCETCGGTGTRPGVPDFEGSDKVVTMSECDCHGTGHRFWRLVREVGQNGAWNDKRYTQEKLASLGILHLTPRGTAIEAVAPTLEILINTAHDLGYAVVFTPDAWDGFLPPSWITVSGDDKIGQTLKGIETAVLREEVANATD